ncbi:bifunctional folylpolyglutamate synthase/dihydrofolate synthase [Hydrogenimonas thermophila]|uniref:bifunctional folylpolyglutamate synthase/dihydrofolate synthase n=1 Tax=Hydrogenimonas thermophila TaxID=223786 RepID=UPI0029371FCE|nr:bifunctional folylpolyglutamate synthase/dihydrofolate synthase [Hydrogenimonas thermophila]WOE70319.1 bifunctional folylpolyglutamate synthase/dihydrofolate synthase [Hydrogenimonas thermophila]WOE72836.1 bifunctional folylpolyglutamate synthase/dihydrofolate synthase [Hydrogenimonas thermophila]
MILLEKFLNSKPLYYDVIDLSRMPKAYEYIKPHIKLGKVIHLVGTNGKGSIGRILSSLLLSKGVSVGHYTSPHILKFNERIWINGRDIDDERLEQAHKRVFSLLPENVANSLSYFEYTTLLALAAFERCDYIVLEAGLGGEFDATNVVEKDLSIIVPIGKDHQQFLGDSLEEIAATKLRSIDKKALLAPNQPDIVLEVAKRIAIERGCEIYRTEDILNSNERDEIYESLETKGWADYLKYNALTAVAAMKLLGFDDFGTLPERVELRGRFEKIATNIILDVGHNELAASAIVKALKGKKVVLVYNTLEDKDAKTILSILSPVIKRVEIISIQTQRQMAIDRLKSIVEELNIPYCDFKSINEEEEFLVFGSFYTAEAFLKAKSNEVN